jgi:hypothetical protein
MKTALRDSFLLTGTINGARYERENRSEAYVTIPPAFMITDERGGMWTFGTEYEIRNGLMEFNVLRNDVDVGEMASRIEYKAKVVTIYGYGYGRKRWTGRAFI